MKPYNLLEDNLNNQNETEKNILLNKDKITVFGIKFDITPPKPGVHFALEIEGIEHDGKTIILPIIQYEGSKIHGFAHN